MFTLGTAVWWLGLEDGVIVVECVSRMSISCLMALSCGAWVCVSDGCMFFVLRMDDRLWSVFLSVSVGEIVGVGSDGWKMKL